MMVDVESIYDTKVIIDDINAGEGGEQKWKDVWGDLNCLQFIQTRQMPSSAIEEELLRAKKWAQNYVWKGNKLCFRNMMVLKLDERKGIVLEMHKEIGHFREQQTFVEICKQNYWHNKTEQVKATVKACKKC